MQNKGIPIDWVEKLKSRCNIVEVASKYISLQRKGKTYWACCPFHHEKTASFAINEAGQYYHCFGCGEGGDVFSLVRKLEGVDFMDAAKMLAKDVNMEIPDFTDDEEILKKKRHRDKLIEICTQTAKYYYKKLNEPIGQVARNYLLKRGVDHSTIVKMGLGYSSDFNSLVKHLFSLGYSKEDMLEAGVVNTNDRGNLYDCMAKRLVFPIFNANSKVCGFSGRAIENDNVAKYKNTAGTPLFNKSYLLYGLNLLRKARVENKNYALLVEGQMDVIACHKAGFTTAVATLGTAFNKYHVESLSRFVDSVIVCFDGDSAGRKAAVKSLEPLLNANFPIKIITIPENKDPDEYIKAYGKDAFQQLIDNAKNVWEFEIYALSNKYNLKDKLELVKFTEQALEILERIDNFAEKDLYLNLVSEISGVNYDVLDRQLRERQMFKQENVDQSEVEQETTTLSLQEEKLLKAEEFVLASALHKKEYAKDVNLNFFVNTNFREFYKFLQDHNFPIISSVYDYYDVENLQWLKNLIYYNFEEISKLENHYKGCVKLIGLEQLYAKQKELTEMLSKASADAKIEILKQIQEITKKIQQKKMEE